MKKHGEAIKKFQELSNKFNKFGLKIVAWGKLAIAKSDNPHSYIVNNKDSIEEIESFLQGYEFGCSETNPNEKFNQDMLIAIKRVEENLSKIETTDSDIRHHVSNAKIAIYSIIKNHS